MKGTHRVHIKDLDHLVLTTENLDKCLDFYVNILGMKHIEKNARHALYFGNSKINIHTKPGEFQPAAAKPLSGSLDLCFVVDNLDEARKEVLAAGYPLETDIVERNGACGPMFSFYLRDPDKNLIELCSYTKSTQ